MNLTDRVLLTAVGALLATVILLIVIPMATIAYDKTTRERVVYIYLEEAP